MLHFRSSVVLKELFQSNLKRPLTGIARNTSPSVAYCFSTACTDVRSVPKVKCLQHAVGWRDSPYTTNGHGTRKLSTKSDDGSAPPPTDTKNDTATSNETATKEAAAEKRRQAGILPSLEDLLFYTIAGGAEKIPAHKFTTALKATGLRTGDPRLKECMENLKVIMKTTSDGNLDRHLFKKCVQSNIVLLTQAFRKKFVIPDFVSFASEIDALYENAKNLGGGQVADYIPQLARFSPDLWAVSICNWTRQLSGLIERK